jgi:hypothetical protein
VGEKTVNPYPFSSFFAFVAFLYPCVKLAS